MSDTEKLPQRKKSIGGFSVTSTDNSHESRKNDPWKNGPRKNDPRKMIPGKNGPRKNDPQEK